MTFPCQYEVHYDLCKLKCERDNCKKFHMHLDFLKSSCACRLLEVCVLCELSQIAFVIPFLKLVLHLLLFFGKHWQ